jgi:prepilin-type N-terminal cleavage/methylation domain-containing protein
MRAVHQYHPSLRRGFTLLELLVVIAIIGVLAAILVPTYIGVQNHAKMTREVNAARLIMTAYFAYSANNDGQFLPGYDKTAQSIDMPSGRKLSGEMCARYPWRLAAYLGERMEDVFLVNDNRKETAPLPHDSFEYQYRASLNPALGINAYCVGGYIDGTSNGFFTKDVVRRTGIAARASSLIVFASARMKQHSGAEETPGHFLITPPKFWRTQWDKPFDRKLPSANFGNIDLRWNDKAICAFLDGHAALMNEEELSDMRHWSNTAAETDNRDYNVQR